MNEKLLEQKAKLKAIEFVQTIDKYFEGDDYKRELALNVFADGYATGATEETKLLSEHIIELQKQKGKLIDENKEAREIIKMMFPIFKIHFLNQPIENYKSNNDYIETLRRAEQFLKENEK